MSVLTLRRGFSSMWIVLGLAVFAAVMALLVSSIVKTLKHVKPVQSSKPPVSAVVWGDYVFSSPSPMAHWLKQHGVAYSVWAQRHPPANHLLKKKTRKAR
jgi:hypothetical protein